MSPVDVGGVFCALSPYLHFILSPNYLLILFPFIPLRYSLKKSQDFVKISRRLVEKRSRFFKKRLGLV